MIIEIIFVLMIFGLLVNNIDYKILKNHHFKKQKWDLNISCGIMDGGGINADITPRNVPNFVLVKDIYKLPFKDRQFKNAICSHTMEHVENPDKFFKELARVSKNVILLVPPLWDFGCFLNFKEHKWQFITLRTKFVNELPARVRLPYWRYQKKFGQKL